jgi:hypothetical protein
MQLRRADTKQWKAVLVECPDGGSFPEQDADGEVIYSNTHFETEAQAWRRLEKEVLAGVSLAGSAVVEAEAALQRARERAAYATKAYSQFCENRLDAPIEANRKS